MAYNATFRFEIRGTLDGQYRENVLYFRSIGIGDANPYSNAAAMLAKWSLSFRNSWLALFPPDYQLDANFCRQISPTGGAYATEDFADAAYVGTRGSSAVSEQLCPCVTFIPPIGVKSAGRCFLPAVDRADYSLNVPTAGYKTAVTTHFTALTTAFTVNGGSTRLVIFSRKLNIVSDVVAFQLSTVIGFQRKRGQPQGV